MSDAADPLIEQSAQRLFAEQVDKGVRECAESGAFDERLWRMVVDNGFALALASEAAGGSGAPWSAAAPILLGLGYWQVPLPLAETMIGSLLLSMAGLPVPDGPIALIEQGHGNDLVARGSGAALQLSGRATQVAWARHARSALLSLRESRRLVLIDLSDAQSVTCGAHHNHARIPADTLELRDAPAIAQAPNPLALQQPVWTLGALARALMMVGALESVLQQSVRYASERVQFGKPIGKNQALQQNLALMAGDAAAARMAALVAAADAPGAGSADAPAAAFSIAAAKVRCGEAATRATAIAHQVHGAIGFTQEHPLHFATRRLWAWREEFGSDAHWAAQLGRAAIAGGSRGFWPALTQRRFDGMR